jgi:haloacetate dehalogenase
MFENFLPKKVKVASSEIDLVTGGHGSPLLLLHGFPQTKIAWHVVAPKLISQFTLIIADLPGYGDSSAPSATVKDENYSKRNFGNILLELMQQLGFEKFAVAGHDRGGRIAYRMALDHPEQITHLAVLDIIPTLEITERMTYDLALDMGNWLFLSQPSPLPETLIHTSSEYYLNYILNSWADNPNAISTEAREEYLRCFQNPDVIKATCEEYRASSIDAKYDKSDRVNDRKITCPVLVLWGEKGIAISAFGDPLKIWQSCANDVRGHSMPTGHFLMEEAPDEVVKEFLAFFR